MSDSYQEPNPQAWLGIHSEDIKGDPKIARRFTLKTAFHSSKPRSRNTLKKYNPDLCSSLSNCLQPELIPYRHRILQGMAERI